MAFKTVNVFAITFIGFDNVQFSSSIWSARAIDATVWV